jgi:hypothetical protein
VKHYEIHWAMNLHYLLDDSIVLPNEIYLSICLLSIYVVNKQQSRL